MKKKTFLLFDVLKGLNGLLFGIATILLSMRFVLRVLGASITPFVSWVYETSQTLLYPFRGIFEPVAFQDPSGSVLELSTLFAILIYGIVYYAIEAALNYFQKISHDTTS